jgi:WD40 repeat protein
MRKIVTTGDLRGRLKSALKGAISMRIHRLQTATPTLPMAVPGLVFLACYMLAHAIEVHAQDVKTKPQAQKHAVDEKTIRALIAQLGDDSFDKREAAGRRLADIGEPARKLLEQAAKENKDAEVRERARLLVDDFITRYFVEVRHFGGSEGNGTWITRVAVTRDGRQAVAAGFAALRSWDLAGAKEAVAFEAMNARYSWALAISPDGQRVIAGGDDRMARVFDLKTGKLVRELAGHTAAVWGAALLGDGKRAITGGWDHSLRVWDVERGQQIRAFDGVPDNVRCLAVSPDGKLVAAGHFAVQDGPATLRLWDLDTATQIRALEGHTREITGVAFSPDGKKLCSSSFDKTVRLWEVATGKELKRFLGHTHRVEAAAFTPNGSRVVSCGDQDDPTVRLWDCASGSQICQTPQSGQGFLHVAALPDGRHCVTGGKDGVVRLWEWKK